MPIKPAYVKRISRALIERYPERFSDDFDENKETVTLVTNVESKRVRNRIAGYVTRKNRKYRK
jgi:small subunit ribosomal protein S17e|tara:strand:- start:17 stop:205 length:189 start_codon:yes stop_codon:yes gene_type:complete